MASRGKTTCVIFGRKSFPGLLVALSLSGCSSEGNDVQELQQFVEQAVNRPPGEIEPLPEFVSYEPFSYSAASLRSPFDVPLSVAELESRQDAGNVQPDENRPRDYLEGFPIGSLTMVGSLGRGNTLWALVLDENGEVHRVTVGDYLGRNHGRIVEVTENRIGLMEIVPSGDGGWIERPQTIALREVAQSGQSAPRPNQVASPAEQPQGQEE